MTLPAVIAIICIVFALVVCAAVLFARQYRRKNEIFLKFDTMAGPLRVYTVVRDSGDMARVMDVEGAFQSATYLEDDRVYELVFEYHRAYNHLFEAGLPITDVLALGGGGYAYPKYLISHYPDVNVDVVEIDPAVTSIAERYFFLDRLIVEFDLDQTGRLGIIEADARAFLEESDMRYSAIVNDCFSGRTPVMSLATQEAAQLVHEHLVEGGVFLSNVIGALEGEKAVFLHSVVKTLQQEFAHVYVVAGNPEHPQMRDNNVVIATDGEWAFSGTYPLTLEDDAVVYQDAVVDAVEAMSKL